MTTLLDLKAFMEFLVTERMKEGVISRFIPQKLKRTRQSSMNENKSKCPLYMYYNSQEDQSVTPASFICIAKSISCRFTGTRLLA